VEKWYGPRKQGTLHYGEVLKAGRAGEPEADLALMKLAEETVNSGMVRASALSLLRGYPSHQMVEALKAGMKDKDPLVRIGAVRALDAIDPKQRYELGAHLLNDPIRAVRTEAGRYLASVPQDGLSPGQQAKLNQTIDEYIQSQLVNAERPSSHLNLGILYAERGQLPKAEEAYHTALRLDAAFYPALVNLADLYRLQKRDNEGEPLLRQALKVAPNDASVHHALGLLLVRTGHNAEAMIALKDAWELQSDNPRYGYVYGIALHSTGKSREALVVLKETLQEHSFDPQILMALVTIHRSQGDQQVATRYAKRLMALSPQDPAVRQLLQQLQSSGQD
jgi:Flp pilus assembly protein TadD